MLHVSFAPGMTTMLLAASAAIAAQCDLRTRRIPNALTFGLAAAAGIAWAMEGPAPFFLAVSLYAVVLIAGCVPFGRGWIGGGDVKLLAAGAACAGFPGALTFLLVTAVAGGVLALAHAARTRRVASVMSSVAYAATSRDFGSLDGGNAKLPYALAIAAGALYLLASETCAPWLRLVRV